MLVFGVDVPLIELILVFSLIIIVILIEVIVVMILSTSQINKSKKSNELVKQLADVLLKLKEREVRGK